MVWINVNNIRHYIYQLKESRQIKRIMSGAFWLFTGTTLSKFIVLVSGIICAHILTKQEYGQLGIVRSTISMFVILGSAGMGVTATKFISQYKKINPERIPSIYILTNYFAFISGILVSILILLLAQWIADSLLQSIELTNSIRIGSILLFVSIINGAQNGTLSGFENFKSIAINTFWGSMAESIFMLLGAYFGGVFGAVLGFGTGYVVIYVLNHLSINATLKKEGIPVIMKNFDTKDLKLLYTFSLPSVLSSMMVAPTFFIIRTILTRNSGFEELAVYEAADQWKIIILFIPSAICQVVLPILSSIESEKSEFWKVLKYNLFLNASIATIISLIVIFASQYIMTLYGSCYKKDNVALCVLAMSTIFTSMASVVGASIQSRGKVWQGFGFNCLWALITIVTTSLLVRKGLGAVGPALAILFAYAIHTIFQLAYLKICEKSDRRE